MPSRPGANCAGRLRASQAVLAAEIREAIEEVIDQDVLNEMTDLGDTERDRILGVISQLDEL